MITWQSVKERFKRFAKTYIQSDSEKPNRDYSIIFLWLIIGIVSLIRYRLVAVPFERDEGEYGYIGNLFLHGIAPFKDAYTMKLPGTSFMYSIFMLIFGHTNTGVHLGVIFMNATTMYFLYAALKKIFDPLIGLATASIYGFMAIGLVFFGFAAHATHFICFFSSIALLFLANFMKSGKALHIFLCGLMFGMAFIMKQQAVFLILFGALFLFIYLWSEKKKNLLKIAKKLLLFGLGVFIPYAIVVLIIVFAGQFSNFWLWTVEYASKYEGTGMSWSIIFQLFKFSFIPAWGEFYYLFILALAGIIVLFITSYTRLQKLFAIMYFVASACAVSAGFYFRQHYFIVLLPAIGLMTGIIIEFIAKQIRRIPILKSPFIGLAILSLVIVFTIYVNRYYYFSDDPKMVCNLAYFGNPFNEAQEIAKYISNDTRDTDKIAILGSEPEICFYANRASATGYLYTYPLVENQPYNEVMQEEMIKEIEKNKPAYLVYCNFPMSWLAQQGIPTNIFEWGKEFSNEFYTPVGLASFFTNTGWQIYWNDDIKNRAINPASYIVIYKRKPG
jgi:hypothetical protein